MRITGIVGVACGAFILLLAAFAANESAGSRLLVVGLCLTIGGIVRIIMSGIRSGAQSEERDD